MLTILGYTLREIIAGTFMGAGVLLMVIAGIGILRMPDTFIRMSVSTKASTLGLGLLLLGTAIYFGELGVTTRALATIVFIFLTAPVSAHAIGRAAYSDGVKLWGQTKVDELEGRYQHQRGERSGPPKPPENP